MILTKVVTVNTQGCVSSVYIHVIQEYVVLAIMYVCIHIFNEKQMHVF
jgi:hypothetical protein